MAEYLTPLATIAALLAALAAFRNAHVAKQSAEQAAAASEGQLLNAWLVEYKSDEMREALRRLRDFDVSRVGAWRDGLKQNDPAAIAIDQSRHLVHGFFSRVARLHRAGLLSERVATEVCQLPGFAIWSRVVDPLTAKIEGDFPYSILPTLRDLDEKYGHSIPFSPIPTTLADHSRRATDGVVPDV